MENQNLTNYTEKEHTNYPSRYAIQEDVFLNIAGKIIKDCRVLEVRFSNSGIKYDVSVPVFELPLPKGVTEQSYVCIENVDSVLVIDEFKLDEVKNYPLSDDTFAYAPK